LGKFEVTHDAQVVARCVWTRKKAMDITVEREV
jgi:hypothetical protein